MRARFLVLFLTFPCLSQVDQEKVDSAIEKGISFLKKQCEKIDDVGAPNPRGNKMRYHELVALTMLHSGLDESDADLKDLIDTILKKKLEHTYVVSLHAMVFQKLDPVKYQWRIAQCAQFLVDNQCKNGQWSYGEEVKQDKFIETGKTSEKPKKNETKPVNRIQVSKRGSGPDTGDNSNSQYAALGLRACWDANVIVQLDVIKKAREWWEKNQLSDGSWNYGMTPPNGMPGPGPMEDGYGSMTCGAVGSVCIYDYMLQKDFRKNTHAQKGAKWIAENFDVKKNPGTEEEERRPSWLYYYLYALERAGILYGAEEFEKHKWYQEGAEFLLKEQKKDGAWVGKGFGGGPPPGGKPPDREPEVNPQAITDTCFAILFLRKATKPLIVETGK